MPAKRIIIHQPWGGLGDNLAFSTLPELYHRASVDFHLSKDNAFRNSEIYSLVWELNPYFKGIADEPSNFDSFKNLPDEGNVLCRVQASHGFKPKKRIVNPVIFYKPKPIPELADTTLLDLSAISLAQDYDSKTLHKIASFYQKHSKASLIVFQNDQVPRPLFELNPTYSITSIFHFCDAIASCREFVCLNTGSAVLAAAIAESGTTVNATCYLHPNQTLRSIQNHYFFDNIRYVETCPPPIVRVAKRQLSRITRKLSQVRDQLYSLSRS